MKLVYFSVTTLNLYEIVKKLPAFDFFNRTTFLIYECMCCKNVDEEKLFEYGFSFELSLIKTYGKKKKFQCNSNREVIIKKSINYI